VEIKIFLEGYRNLCEASLNRPLPEGMIEEWRQHGEMAALALECLARRAADDHVNAALTAPLGEAYEAREATLSWKRKSDQYEAELKALRSADDGAVVVDGYAEARLFDGVPWEVRGKGRAHAELRFYDLPMTGTIPAVVTIRRRAEKGGGR